MSFSPTRMPTVTRALRIGTRQSDLAIAQAILVAGRLSDAFPDLDLQTIGIRTEGDVDKETPLEILGGRGVFATALQQALLRGDIDLAVHCAKDLPPREPDGLALVSFPEREDPRDVLVSRHGLTLAELPAAPRIGTSSRRRAAQILAARPDATIVNLRGNVDTRLRKASLDEFDAIVIAGAGLIRMGRTDQVTEWLPLDTFIPAPGQGALAVETRAADREVIALMAAIDDPSTHTAVAAERLFLRELGAGCSTPLGAFVDSLGSRLRLRAMLADASGQQTEWITVDFDRADADSAPVYAARELLSRFKTGVLPQSARPDVTTSRQKPLHGLKALITRAKSDSVELGVALADQGAEPVFLPTIQTTGPADVPALDRALQRAASGEFDLLVFSSQNAVRSVQERCLALRLDPAAPDFPPAAAVGDKTAAALSAAGFRVGCVASEPSAAGLVRALAASNMNNQRVLFPRGDLAGDTIERGLARMGAIIEPVEAYRTVPELDVNPVAIERVRNGEIDLVVFSSPSAVHGLAAIVGDPRQVLANAVVICSGPTTAAAVNSHGLVVSAVASDPSTPGLVQAASECVRIRSRGRIAADLAGQGDNQK